MRVERVPGPAGSEAAAAFSEDRRYRYWLTRQWSDDPWVCFIMLNPSTADAHRLDPTGRRCHRWARAWGHGGLLMLNLFGLRSTDPRALYRDADPVGPGNDLPGLHGGFPVGRTVAAWGAHGTLLQRGSRVLAQMADAGIALHALGLTGAGHPRHPLYLRSATFPVSI